MIIPKTHFGGEKKVLYRMKKIPWPQIHDENHWENITYFRRFGTKEPRHSEKNSAKKRYTYLYRSTRRSKVSLHGVRVIPRYGLHSLEPKKGTPVRLV